MVRINDHVHAFKNIAELPKENFTLSAIQLTENAQVSDARLAHFRDCKNLRILHLNNTKVGDAGLAYFKDCKNLDNLGLGGTHVGDGRLRTLRTAKT